MEQFKTLVMYSETSLKLKHICCSLKQTTTQFHLHHSEIPINSKTKGMKINIHTILKHYV